MALGCSLLVLTTGQVDTSGSGLQSRADCWTDRYTLVSLGCSLLVLTAVQVVTPVVLGCSLLVLTAGQIDTSGSGLQSPLADYWTGRH
jgi:hypothetical protein